MVTLEELRSMILEVSSDNEVHTRQELIAYAREKYEMRLYDADQRVTSAIKSLLKKGDLTKLDKGVYQLNDEQRTAEIESPSADTPRMDHIM